MASPPSLAFSGNQTVVVHFHPQRQKNRKKKAGGEGWWKTPWDSEEGTCSASDFVVPDAFTNKVPMTIQPNAWGTPQISGKADLMRLSKTGNQLNIQSSAFLHYAPSISLKPLQVSLSEAWHSKMWPLIAFGRGWLEVTHAVLHSDKAVTWFLIKYNHNFIFFFIFFFPVKKPRYCTASQKQSLSLW